MSTTGNSSNATNWLVGVGVIIFFLIIGKCHNCEVEATAQGVAEKLDNSDLHYESKSRMAIGNKSYEVLDLGKMLWMAEDLDADIGENYQFNFGESYFEYYDENGNKAWQNVKTTRMYTQEGAKTACGAYGWRLPTRADWKRLIKYATNNDSTNQNLAFGRLTTIDNELRFGVLLEGSGVIEPGESLRFYGYGDEVHLWTSSFNEGPTTIGFYRKKGTASFYRSNYNNSLSFHPCRCVLNKQEN
ncbi:MAG TPA: FISUMP domain-containing protein [Saprospiraceae bacterium]|nr:FISUMP domain-containing protein [Saprospiraceae bacterium]